MAKKNASWNDDFYTKKARNDDFKARSAFKLQEIDAKYRLFQPGQSVLDLGCAPGSWLQYVLRRIGGSGSATGIDLQETVVAGAICIQADIYQYSYENMKPVDAVISDMAPSTSGQPFVDAQRSLELCERAFEIASVLLKKNGFFICKIFQGEDLDSFFKSLKPHFKAVHRFKPESSRDKSRELFIIGTGFQQ